VHKNKYITDKMTTVYDKIWLKYIKHATKNVTYMQVLMLMTELRY